MKWRRCTGQILFAAALLALFPARWGGKAAAQTASGIVVDDTPEDAQSYWTPRRLLNAMPLDEAVPARIAGPIAALPPARATSPGGSSSPPKVWIAPQPEDLVNAPVDLDSLPPSGVSKDASLGSGVFTESRVIPPNTGQTAPAVNAYPYSAVGKLFSHDPRSGQNFVCSAATNGKRAVLTAGHCIAHGSPLSGQRYFYDKILFVPAYDNGAAPYGEWLSSGYKLTSNDWFFSGTLPNAHDFALFETRDHKGSTVGAAVGWLGWQTFRLGLNHFTALGYPCNLDNCMLMQRNDAQTSGFGGNNTWVQGSDMGAGAGGGPWVQDFGLNPKGAPAVPFGGNVVVGVTSYTPASGIGYLGASQFDQVFVNMRNAFCAHKTGNC